MMCVRPSSPLRLRLFYNHPYILTKLLLLYRFLSYHCWHTLCILLTRHDDLSDLFHH